MENVHFSIKWFMRKYPELIVCPSRHHLDYYALLDLDGKLIATLTPEGDMYSPVYKTIDPMIQDFLKMAEYIKRKGYRD